MSNLHKAVLKTLAYSAVFNFPLTISEIKQYLIGYRLRSLSELNFLFRQHKLPIAEHQGFFWLSKEERYTKKFDHVLQRGKRQERARKLMREVQKISERYLRRIPTVQMVVVTGSTAALNANKNADIDLLVVTSSGTKWLTRALVLLALELKNERVDLTRSAKFNAGKCCLNMVLEESRLTQKQQDLYTANEIARMKPVLVRGDTYRNFLKANKWVGDFLPNWKAISVTSLPVGRKFKYLKKFIRPMENAAGWYQKRHRKKWLQAKTDHREEILAKYKAELFSLGKL